MQNNKAIKVLLVADGISPYQLGGMQKFAQNWIKYMSGKINLTVIHPHPNYEKECSGKAVYIPLPNVPSFLPGAYMLNQRLWSIKIKNFIIENDDDFDIIYFQGFTGYDALKSKQIKGVKYLNLHGLEMFQKTRKSLAKTIFKIWAAKMIKKADFNIALGTELSKVLLDIVPQEKIVTWPNAIDDEWLITPESNTKGMHKWLFVGRDEERKRLDLIISCFSHFAQQNPLFRLTLVGPITEKYEHAQITYLGEVSNEEKMISIYDGHDVFILMSDAEGVPTVLLEAMSRGLLVLSRVNGAISDLINENNAFVWKEDLNDYTLQLFEQWGNLEIRQDALRTNAQQTLRKNLFLWSDLAHNMLKTFERNLN